MRLIWMDTLPTKLPGVMLLKPPRFDDERGAFRPIFANRLHAEAGYTHEWAEMNLSHTRQNSIRGLHLQDPESQAKLITVISGRIFDVAVDLRKDSPTFGQWDSFELGAESDLPSQIYLPEGIAHGLATPHGEATIAYLVSRPWNPATEKVLAWDDPDLGIDWPVDNPSLSPRDAAGMAFEEVIG